MKTSSLFMGFVCLFLSLSLSAQHEKDEATIRKQITNFTSAFSEFTAKKDKNVVLRLMTPDASANITYIDLNNNVRSRYYNYASFVNRLDAFIASGQVKRYSNTVIHSVKVNGNIGVVSLSNNVSLNQGSETLLKGSQIATFVMKKINNLWKIHSYSLTETTDEKYKGDCYCDLFSKGTSDYASKVKVPTGSNYTDNLDIFSFRQESNNTYIIVGDKNYKWVENINIYTLDESGQTVRLLGKARNQQEAVIVILKNDLYMENCTNVILRK